MQINIYEIHTNKSIINKKQNNNAYKIMSKLTIIYVDFRILCSDMRTQARSSYF